MNKWGQSSHRTAKKADHYALPERTLFVLVALLLIFGAAYIRKNCSLVPIYFVDAMMSPIGWKIPYSNGSNPGIM